MRLLPYLHDKKERTTITKTIVSKERKRVEKKRKKKKKGALGEEGSE